jgi:non-specific serine/threonine protein kinase/serine/threonine-protein kinase
MSGADAPASRWERINELVYEALRRAPAERASFLDQACGADARLRSEAASMLAAEAQMDPDFLKVHARDHGAEVAAPRLARGQLFAERFLLLRRLGEGGMGQVWLADQLSPVQRPVALKLVRPGIFDETVVRRFIGERQSLAMMDHPAIAKVFEAGATPQGEPYLTMEYVPGLPITDYCDNERLGIRARLDLFIQACEGVQHAHLKAVIHRDLKPPNILVAEIDGKPVPRIIDFGLAKAVRPAEERRGDDSTRLGLFVGTPGYMSPEQLGADGQDVDTRTDVYSLGVILYVLLTGLQPFETKAKNKPPLDVWLRRLREDEPPRPSVKLSGDRDTTEASAQLRGTDLNRLVHELRGDLDWITLKALERNRELRYTTPADLAADLRRYLDHEPVLARPAGTLYRLHKYLRRNRLAVAISVGLVLLLTGFSLLQGLELRRTAIERDRANQERDRANQERDRASRITDFMIGMFTVADPSETRGRSVTAREILDHASQTIQADLAQDSQAQSQLMHVMANSYLNLGLYGRAHELLTGALKSRLATLGPENRDTLASRALLARVTEREGKYFEAEAMDRQTLADERRILGLEDPLTLETMDNYAFMLYRVGDYAGEERVARQLIDIATRRLGPESPLTLRAKSRLGGALMEQSRFAESEELYRPLIELDRRILGPDDPQTMEATTNLASAIDSQGRHLEAEPIYRQNLADLQRVFGPEHDMTVHTLEQLATLVQSEGRTGEAERMDREIWEVRSRTLGPDHPRTLLSESYLGLDLLQLGRVDAAEPLERAALQAQRRVIGAGANDTLLTQTWLVRILVKQGRLAEAEPLAREALDLAAKNQNRSTIVTAMGVQGLVMAQTHRYSAAKDLFLGKIATETDSEVRSELWMNFAAVALAARDPDGAMNHIQEAIGAGFSDVDNLSNDQEWNAIRNTERFQRLLAEVKRRAAATAAAGPADP